MNKKTEDTKAIKLLSELKSSHKKLEKISNEWVDKDFKASSKNERDKLNRSYIPKLEKAAKKADTDYEKYYKHIHKNYDKNSIDKAVNKTRDFTSKSFLKELGKEVKANETKKCKKRNYQH